MPVRALSPELQAKAYDELNEVPERIQDDLKHIREWLEEQPHLNARTDDQWLLTFLRGCKFNLQRTQEKLDMFYTMRTMVPEFFGSRDPLSPSIQELLTFGTCIPLPKTSDPTSTATILIRHKSVDCDKIHVLEVLKSILMILDILIMEDDNFAVSGINVIDDLKGVPFKHVLQMTPSNAKKTISCFQTAYPVRPKQLHFLNTFGAVESILKVIKFFMSEKIRNRVNVYSEKHVNDMQRLVPADILPNEYGGTAGPLDEMIAEWKNKVESYRDWYLEDAKYCSDETKRPQKEKTDILTRCKEFFSNMIRTK